MVVMTGVTILIGYIRNLNFRLGHLAQIVDSSTDAIISKDLDGIVLSWNKGAEEIFGWTAKEMIGQSIRKIIPETRQKEEDFILDNIRHGRPVSHLETVRRAKNGQLLDVFLSVSPVRNQYGKVVGASKMLRNISERKLSEARFQAQFKGTPVPIFSWKLTDGDFILTEFNDAAEQITHGKIHELMHRKASEVYANTPEVLELMWKTFNTKSTIRREGPFRFLTTGETRFLDVSFIYVHPDFVMIHTEDITERKEVERRIRESEERYQLAQEAGEIATWEWNPVTQVTTWSRNLPEIFGISDEEAFTFTNFMNMVHPEDRETIRKSLTSVSAEKTDYDVEFRIIDPRDGRIRWLMGRGKLFLDELGNPRKLVGCNMDITDRKLINQELREAKEQAEQASKSKDEFLAVISHELKTPLSSILGYSSLLASGRLGSNTDAAKMALNTIERSARNQASLIEDLLDISRIVSGRMQIKRLIVGIPGIVQQACESFAVSAAEKGVELKCEECTDKIFVSGDPGRLQQILANLVDNAVKFTPKGGKVHVSIVPDKLKIHIIVKDSGVGIEPQFMKELFQRFKQESSGIRRLGQGLGLGLSIAKSLAELQGGSIKAASEGRGKGATFTVTFPLSSPPLEESVIHNFIQGEEKQTLEGMTILAIDDDRDTLTMLKVALERFGAVVLTAESAEEGRILGEANKLTMIVCDVGMPVVSGYEFIRTLRAEKINTPALALTAFSGDEYAKLAKESGFNHYLSKPIEIGALIEGIHFTLSTVDKH